MSCCHYDERTRGARQDGGSAVVALVLSSSEGTDPRVSPPAVLKYRLGRCLPIVDFLDRVELRNKRTS